MLKRKGYARGVALGLVLVMVIGSVALAESKVIRFTTDETDPKSVANDELLIAQFERKYPEVKIFPEYIGVEDINMKFIAMTRAGINPDILYTGSKATYKLYEMDALLPVDDLIERLGDIGQNYLDPYTYGGQIYGVPVQGGGDFVWYRNDWFAEKGLTAPRFWSDMLKAAEVLTDKKKGVYGMGMVGLNCNHNQEYFVHRMWDAGGYFFDEQLRIALSTKYREQGLKTLAYEKALSEFAPPGFIGHGYMDNRMNFINGKTAMVFMSSRIPGDILRTKPELDELGIVGVVAPPIADEGGRANMWGGPNTWCIASNSKYPDVAKNFIYEAMSGERYIDFLLTVPFHLWPCRDTYASDPRFINSPVIAKHPDWVKVFTDSMPLRHDFTIERPGGVFNPRFGDCLMSRALADAVNAFHAGSLSAGEALDEVAEAWQDITEWELAPVD